jgi:hypothetical protein
MDLWPADRLPLFLPGRDLMRSVPLLGRGDLPVNEIGLLPFQYLSG